MKPNKARIRKWVKALRSGEYQQGKDALRKGDKFCCLGVACDLYAKAHPEKVTWMYQEVRGGAESLGYIGYEFPSGDPQVAVLPEPVMEWLGIEEDNPILIPTADDDSHDSFCASELNDDENYSFAQIADAIEATYLA